MTSVSIIDYSFQYPILILSSVFFILLIFKKGTFPKLYFIDILAFIPLVIWTYGLFIAILYQNNYYGIIRNFAGILFYITYFMLIFWRISYRQLLTVLIRSSIIYVLIVLAYSDIGTYFGSGFKNYERDGLGVFRLYYSLGLAIFFPTLFIYSSNYIPTLKNDAKRLALVKKNPYMIFALLCCLAFSGSKGFYLGVLVILVIVFLLSIFRLMKTLRISLLAITFVVISVPFIISFYTEIVNKIGVIFLLEFDATHPRVIQREELISDFSFFGKGLGGVIEGYERDFLGYGFELSYLNIIHKFGIFSIFIFISFITPVFYSFYKIFVSTNKINSYLPLMLMIYLIPALGNPIIFAPISVLLHCIAIYLIRLKYIELK